MKLSLSWLKEYVDLDLPLEDIARALLSVGLEVEQITVVGLPFKDTSANDTRREFRISGITWDREKFVVAEILEVMPHPNADRLVLCKLNDGGAEPLTILTGAPNLFEYKGKGLLSKTLKVAYAREGACLYDGHQPGRVLTTLKRAVIRGVESFSMVCSEKELGISEEHEGVIILDADAPVGMPLVDYMGDAVFEVNILPNMIRDACVLGVARELAAYLGKPLRKPQARVLITGASIDGKAALDITDPALNPRFVLGLIRGVEPRPSPYKVQMRLRLAGMRSINGIVDATNYVMLELGQPLHAFDYDVLLQRTGGKPPTIITRPAKQGEKLKTLDGVERELDDFTIMVCDTAGALSLAGVMGGEESEVRDNTRNVLLEGAAWNFVNIRRTVFAQKLNSEAAFRFARGVHPSLAEYGVRIGLDRMAEWSGGEIAAGLVDSYPQPFIDPQVFITVDEVTRGLGVEIPVKKITEMLTGLEFKIEVKGKTLVVQSPDHRMDIHDGVVGKADILEEIARMYGYDNIPAVRLADLMPPVHPQPAYEAENHIRDLLTLLGMQEVITYRLTDPAREARLTPPGIEPPPVEAYIAIKNPLTPERSHLRRGLLSSVLEIAEQNIRNSEHLALFEVGPVFIPEEEQVLPVESLRLALVMTGRAYRESWDRHIDTILDFFDLKGVIESLLAGLHVDPVHYEVMEGAVYHPGKCARVLVGEKQVGVFGELHPLVKERYDLGISPVLTAEFDLDALLPLVPNRHETASIPDFPPVLEDIAVVVDEGVPAEQVEAFIHQAGGKMVTRVRLFDIFQGEQLGPGKKSLAYNLTYQATDRTLTDAEAAQIRTRIVKRLEQELGAKLRT
jgi:phenylalanyl-tRNA synthetase beta chain